MGRRSAACLYQFGAGDESLYVQKSATQKLFDEGEVLLPPGQQLTDAGVVYLKAIGVQITGLVRQRHEAFLPTCREKDRGESDGVCVIAVRLLEAAGEADLLDDGAEGRRADGQE